MTIFEIRDLIKKKPRHIRIAELGQWARQQPKRSELRKQILQELAREVVQQLKAEHRAA